jgi:hypothetical protein
MTRGDSPLNPPIGRLSREDPLADNGSLQSKFQPIFGKLNLLSFEWLSVAGFYFDVILHSRDRGESPCLRNLEALLDCSANSRQRLMMYKIFDIE